MIGLQQSGAATATGSVANAVVTPPTVAPEPESFILLGSALIGFSCLFGEKVIQRVIANLRAGCRARIDPGSCMLETNVSKSCPQLRVPTMARVQRAGRAERLRRQSAQSQPPAARISWGPATTDEMAGLHIEVVPVDADDTDELTQALWGKMMRSLGGGIYRPGR